MNDNNLIPNNERSPSELREMGRKGGLASGRSRRKKKELQKLAKSFLFPDAKKLSEECSRTLNPGRSPSEPRKP